MCFLNKNGERLIRSRRYAYLSGKLIIYFGKKKYERLLKVSFANNEGEMEFIIFNISDNKEELVNKDPTGLISFNLKENKKYKLIIKSKRAIGSYKVSLVKHER